MLLSRGKNLSQILLAILLLVLPLIYILGMVNPYGRPKFLFFVIGVWLLGVVRLLEVLFSRENRRLPTFDRLTLLVLIYGLICFVSDLLGLDSRTSILGSYWRHQGWLTLTSGILLFFILRLDSFTGSAYIRTCLASARQNLEMLRILNRSRIGFLLTNRYWPVLVDAFLVSLFACWQGIRLYLLHDLTVPHYNGRIVGTLGNPSFLGGFLAMSLPLVLASKSRLKPFVLAVS